MNVSQNQNNLRASRRLMYVHTCIYIYIYIERHDTHKLRQYAQLTLIRHGVCPRYCYYYYYHDLGNGSYSVGGYIICESGECVAYDVVCMSSPYVLCMFISNDIFNEQTTSYQFYYVYARHRLYRAEICLPTSLAYMYIQTFAL